jgi:uncharacterized oxidoreductase
MNLSGNTILITGGSSGIGLEFAKVLLAKKNTVIITGRSEKKLLEAKAALPGVVTIQSDAGNADSINALFKKVISEFPKLNILINNAGIMRELNFNDQTIPDETLIGEIQTNLMGPIRLSKIFIPHLKQQSSSAIVNISSGLAFVPLPISPVYCATKAALHSFTRSLRVQLKRSSIKVFEIAPPATETPLLSKANKDDMKGISIMPVDKMVEASITGMEKDQCLICPGQSSSLKFMGRIAPEFIFKQLSKSAERML